MDFDYTTGTLYWAAYLGQGDSRMTTVDTATGAATVVGNIADGNEVAFVYPGHLCRAASLCHTWCGSLAERVAAFRNSG